LKANPPNPSNLNDTSNYFPDPKSPDYELGSFIDVNVTDYYRNPNHILIVQDSVIRFISSTIRMNPIFYIRAEYSKTRGQKTPKIVFPLIWARYDVIIRFTVKL